MSHHLRSSASILRLRSPLLIAARKLSPPPTPPSFPPKKSPNSAKPARRRPQPRHPLIVFPKNLNDPG